jgi:Family of unknown function (DUF6590)
LILVCLATLCDFRRLNGFIGYKVHHGSEYRVGTIFKILWAEPAGVNGSEISLNMMASTKYGESFVHKIRRFVVVKTFNGHCLCLAILTYAGQGYSKAGASADHHAALYSGDDGPYLLEREVGLTSRKPLKINLTSPSEKLDPLSRVNYAKVYTIEYNVKAFIIGRVAPKFRHQLLADLQNVLSMDFRDE